MEDTMKHHLIPNVCFHNIFLQHSEQQSPQVSRKKKLFTWCVTYRSLPILICMIDLFNIPFFTSSLSLDILSETVDDPDFDAIKTTCRDDADKENKMKVAEAACDDA